MKRRIVAVVLGIMVMALLVASPVLAIAPPDTPPALNWVYAYEDCIEDGDLGIFIEYFLDYAAVPTEDASEAYIISFVDTDGTTLIKSITPYVFQNSGYDGGNAWIYFTAAEVTTYSLDAVDVALYSVWITGNPMLSWTGTGVPKTIAGLDGWSTIADPSTLIALRVLYYADKFELEWSLDLIEVTTAGNKLTVLGASYFQNVIASLTKIAPAAFANTTVKPTLEDISYSTEFGAILTSAVVVGSPVTLVEGVNNLNAGGAGTATVVLSRGTIGTVTGANIAGSPLDLVAGTNTVTITGAGAFTADMELRDLSTILWGSTTGTGFDLTTVATAFGMTRWVFSGIVWILMTVAICAALYGQTDKLGFQSPGSGPKVIMVLFNLCCLGGTLLGLLHPVVGILLFIASIGLTTYVLVFRGASF